MKFIEYLKTLEDGTCINLITSTGGYLISTYIYRNIEKTFKKQAYARFERVLNSECEIASHFFSLTVRVDCEQKLLDDFVSCVSKKCNSRTYQELFNE